jgi:drug/metabolite transporter (DMT)-like permease
MGFYYGSMLLTVLSNACYHLCQRSIDPKVDPLVSLTVTYVVALLATLIALPFFSTGLPGIGAQFRTVNWASYALGAAAVGLEVGFLLVYRAGWKVSLGALVSNAAVTMLLIPLGVLLFHERLDPRRLIGILFASVGLWLLSGG